MPEHLDDLSRSFRRALRAEGAAKRTPEVYLESVRQFVAWLGERGRPATLDELTRGAIRGWLADLVESGRAPATVKTRFKGMHRFAGWLVAEELLEAHPMNGLSVPTVPETPVPIFSDAELAALLKTCGGKDFHDRRDEAALRMLIDCGVRVSELCGLAVDDVDLDNETALVTGKGSKRRAVYFGARTARALDRYLRERRKHRWVHLDKLFLTQRGALSADGARQMVRARARQAGVDGAHPHRFRHSFAHDFLISGGGERDLKRLAGWSSDAMLERYGASAADLRAREAVRRLRRGDRL